MSVHLLIKETHINRPIEEVFAFFSNAENLQRITPAFLHFKIITPLPLTIAKNSLIDYRLQLFGIPFRWKTRITEWEPPFKFADEQLKGPYALWYHEHFFEPVEGGTLMIDKLSYKSPGGFLEPIPHLLFVKRNVEHIFNYRAQCLASIFADGEDQA